MALVATLAVAAPLSAAEITYGYIRGTAVGPTGNPALGARVFANEDWAVVQADGSFEIEVSAGTYRLHVFNGVIGMDQAYYPYEEVHLPDQIAVAAGQTRTVNVVVPFKKTGPPELGAVAGSVAADPAIEEYQTAYLVSGDGRVHGSYADLDGTFLVAAPPGDYRLYVMPYRAIGDWIPAFYGDHQRGFAAGYTEAEVLTITGAGATVLGKHIATVVGDFGGNMQSPDEETSLGYTDIDRPITIKMVTAEVDPFARVARQTIGADLSKLESYRLYAYPGLQGAPGSVVVLETYSTVATSYPDDKVPVWLNHQPVPDCDQDATVDPCVIQRYWRNNFYTGLALYTEVATSEGGTFAMGPRPQFYDAEGSVFGLDVLWLAESGITKGCTAGGDLFCPHAPVTRGQMAAFLHRALDLAAATEDAFADDDASIFESSIQALASAGITKGCNPPVNDRFCPDAPVTRGQMAAFLVRAISLGPTGAVEFIDDDHSVFESQIEILAGAGITKGCNPPANDQFCPDDVVTRGQMAAFLYRALGP